MSTLPNPFRYLRYPLLWLIRGYQRGISPLLPPACRFTPTCSEYAYEAIAEYGIITGGRLALWRVLRCNPWGGCGYDPVPLRHPHHEAEQMSDPDGAEPTATPGAGDVVRQAHRMPSSHLTPNS